MPEEQKYRAPKDFPYFWKQQHWNIPGAGIQAIYNLFPGEVTELLWWTVGCLLPVFMSFWHENYLAELKQNKGTNEEKHTNIVNKN